MVEWFVHGLDLIPKNGLFCRALDNRVSQRDSFYEVVLSFLGGDFFDPLIFGHCPCAPVSWGDSFRGFSDPLTPSRYPGGEAGGVPPPSTPEKGQKPSKQTPSIIAFLTFRGGCPPLIYIALVFTSQVSGGGPLYPPKFLTTTNSFIQTPLNSFKSFLHLTFQG